nr:reverse transcriptase domain-containing protein [Tanacetum cinerariifolium]
MTLELADKSITHPKGVVEDVFVKVGKFHFPTDFVVVDFEADPRVPQILGRSFLRTGRALIDVYREEITLRVIDESVTINLDQIIRYSDNSVSRVNVINIASEEVVQDKPKSSNPTLVSESDFCEDPIVKTSPFGKSDFFSEEIENFLKDDSIPMKIENSVFDPEGDILLIEKLLNEDPCQLLPMNLNQAKSPIKVPEYSFSMGYEHFITTPVTELNEVTESSAKNLVPILSEYEATSDNKSEYNEPIKDDYFSAFTTFTNPLFNDKDDFTIHDEDVPIKEFKVYSNPLFDDDDIYSDELESHCLNVESNFVESLSNHDTVNLMERLITINPCPRPIENAYTIVESLPLSLIPVQDNDSQSEEIDIVTDTDELLPPGFKKDDSEGEIYVLEGLRVDNSIPNSKNKLSDNEASDQDDSSFPRPPPEPPDDEFDFELNSGEVISAVMNNIKELIDDECFDPGGEIDIFANVEDDDYIPFTLVIQTFLPYLVYPEVFLLLLSAGSEDTIFDHGISV